jgi:hypothetical protein
MARQARHVNQPWVLEVPRKGRCRAIIHAATLFGRAMTLGAAKSISFEKRSF